MQVHTKDKQVHTFQNYSLIHSFMPLNHPHTFFLKSKKTYLIKKTLDATTVPWVKPMKKHFSPNLIPTYVVKSSKPKKTIPAVSQSIGLMDSAKLKTFLQLTFSRLMQKGMKSRSSRELQECSREMLSRQSSLSATLIKTTNNIPTSLIFLTS